MIHISKLKPSALLEALGATFKRFPLASIFLYVSTLSFILYIVLLKRITCSNRQNYEYLLLMISYALSIGIFVYVNLKLWFESGVKLRKYLIVQVIAYLLIVADAVYFYFYLKTSYSTHIYHTTENFLIQTAFVFLMLVLSGILPFNKEKNDISFWNFYMRKYILNCLISGILGAIILGGVYLFMLSLEFLFNITIPNTSLFYPILCVLTLYTFPMQLFLTLLPLKDKVINNEICISKFHLNIVKYVFIPILTLYLAVLYVYGFKILITMSLPCGWVSKLVMVLAFGIIMVIFLIYPIIVADRVKLKKLTCKIMPALMLLLLLLMSVAIGRRVYDYGVTVSRIYVIAINLWLYSVCIYLLISKTVRLRWILISFCFFFIVLSIGPLSSYNLSRKILKHDVNEILEKYNYSDTVFTSKNYAALISKMDINDAHKLNSRLYYLLDDLNIVDEHIEVGLYDMRVMGKKINALRDSNERIEEQKIISFAVKSSDVYDIVPGYRYFFNIHSCDRCNYEIDNDVIHYTIQSNKFHDTFIFDISISTLLEYHNYYAEKKTSQQNTLEQSSLEYNELEQNTTEHNQKYKLLQIKDKAGMATLDIIAVEAQYNKDETMVEIGILGNVFFN